MVTGLVLIFAFTAGAVVWLARDVDRSVSNRSSAQSIAFQAARAGAQQVDAGSVRSGAASIVVDPGAARRAAERTASRLLTAYELDGSVTAVEVGGDRVVVTVVVEDPAGSVTGVGAARAEGTP
jgi:hypothetical protein